MTARKGATLNPPSSRRVTLHLSQMLGGDAGRLVGQTLEDGDAQCSSPRAVEPERAHVLDTIEELADVAGSR